MAVCRSCKRSIFFAVTDSGSYIPVDYQPSDRGTLVPLFTGSTVERDDRGRPRMRVLTAAQMMAYHGQRYIAHFATCTAPGRHRRRRSVGSTA